MASPLVDLEGREVTQVTSNIRGLHEGIAKVNREIATYQREIDDRQRKLDRASRQVLQMREDLATAAVRLRGLLQGEP